NQAAGDTKGANDTKGAGDAKGGQPARRPGDGNVRPPALRRGRAPAEGGGGDAESRPAAHPHVHRNRRRGGTVLVWGTANRTGRAGAADEPTVIVVDEERGKRQEMSIEEYVAAVVAGEMKRGWP